MPMAVLHGWRLSQFFPCCLYHAYVHIACLPGLAPVQREVVCSQKILANGHRTAPCFVGLSSQRFRFHAGHAYVASLALAAVQRELDGLGLSKAAALARPERPDIWEDLPPPMFAGNYETQGACAINEDFHSVVKEAQGFEWINEGGRMIDDDI